MMGGGKSFAAVRDICYHSSTPVIYAVPTIELAKEIESHIRNADCGIYEENGGFKDVGLDENGERYKLDLPIKVILSDEYHSVQKEFIDALIAYGHYAIIVTHACLFALENFNLLKGWKVFIDEDPHPLRVDIISDALHQIHFLNNLISNNTHDLSEVTEFTIDDATQKQLEKLACLEYGQGYRDSIKNYLQLLIDPKDKLLCFKNSEDKSIWGGVEWLPLKEIIQAAKETHILASILSPLTHMYAEYKGIEIKPSPLSVRYCEYPKSLQKKVSIYRIWKDEPHSINLIKRYGKSQFEQKISDFVNGREFISRSNEVNQSLFKQMKNHKERLSKKTNGINRHDEKTMIVDCAAYNKPKDINEIYKFIGTTYNIPVDKLIEGHQVQEGLEPSAQAVCRIGLRRIDNAPANEYIIVIPDQSTEDYLKKFYFPHANYKGPIITEDVSNKAGPKEGSTNQNTIEKVAKAKELIEGGLSMNKAVKQVGTTKSTYNKYSNLV